MISAAKTLKKFKNLESPKMVSKRLYGHYLRSYEQIKKNRILKRDFELIKKFDISHRKLKKRGAPTLRFSSFLIMITIMIF